MNARCDTRGWARALCLLVLVLAAVACGKEEEVREGPPATRLDAMDLAAVGGDAVRGTLHGEDFAAVEARYRVETFPGRERVDLYLSDTPLVRCGLPIVRDGRMVWLRFGGVTALPTGEQRLSADAEERPFELHYEMHDETDRRFFGRAGGDAVVSLEAPELGQIRGKIFACFGDGHDSCVKGSFTATPCFSRVDGRALREGVGLEDEALEPPREGDTPGEPQPSVGGGDTETLPATAADDAPAGAQEEAE